MGLKIVNNAYGILAAGITAGAVTIPLQTGHGARFGTLAAGDFLFATLINGANQLEVVKITARDGDNLTAVRGQDGTTGIAFSAGDRIEDRPCRAAMLEFLLKTDFGSYAATLGLVPTTGDVKLTLKIAADSGWVMCNDGTIGNATSGGTTRADADTADLFALLWNNVADAQAAVSGGRGANAAADYAANKTIALTKMLGRAFGASGAGAGLTSRVLGLVAGAETAPAGTSGAHALTIAEIPVHAHPSAAGPGPGSPDLDPITATTQQLAQVGTTTGSAGGGGSHAHTTPSVATLTPTAFVNAMIKL